MIRNILTVVFALQYLSCFTQIRLSLKEAESQLQKNNLLLLAEEYNVSVSQAAVIQAKIWDLPYFSGEFNLVNPQEKKAFDIGGQGQKGLAVQQLIYMGGKKKNEIAFARSNVLIAELEFEQLLRNLKHQLSQNFYNVYFDNLKVNYLDEQITTLDTLVNNYSIQGIKGNIPVREVVRLQALALNLKMEKNNLIKEIFQARQNLSLLTGMTDNIEPLVNEDELFKKFQNSLISKDDILNTALVKDIDYLTSIKIMESQELYLKWQKSLSVPDITAGLSYDQRGGAFQNQVNFTLGIPLPIWNRNKGNVKIAEAQWHQFGIKRDFKRLEIQMQVESYWQIWQQQLTQFQNIDSSSTLNLAEVYKGMLLNFQKRNITLFEFTDFMESYNQAFIQINEIKKALIFAGLNINYITNKEIF